MAKKKRAEKREFERMRCNIPIAFSVYSAKKIKGKSALKNASRTGLKLTMRRNPEIESIIVIQVDEKRMQKYVDYGKIILDPSGKPLVRVVYSSYNKRRKAYDVGVRFLMRPRADMELH